MKHFDVLIEPVLSEKTNMLREEGKYVFKVDSRASKIQVKEAVRLAFKVNPVACNVMWVKAKPKRRGKSSGVTATWKKAIVRLAPGEHIQLFEGV